MDSERLTLRVREAARLADVCENTILGWLREGKVPYVRFGKAIRISRAGFLAFLQGQETAK